MRLLFFCFSILFLQKATAQNFTLCNPKENAVYVGLNTALKVTVENTNHKDIVLTSRDATITKNEDGTFELIAIKKGKIAVVVWKKNKKRQLDSLGISWFDARSIPDPEASVSGIHFGGIKKNVLEVVSGVIALIYSMDIDSKFVVTSYKCIIISQNGAAKHFPANDALFT